MLASLRSALGNHAARRRLTLMFGFLIAFNVAIWAVTLLIGIRYPFLLGSALVAYGFGLRHAVDPDHIAAIDNTTRKLMQEHQRPVGVGFFFSWGHSTIVILLSILLALSTSFVRDHLPGLKSTGSLIGTSVSAAFLILIGAINLVVLLHVWRHFRELRRGVVSHEHGAVDFINNQGLLARLFRPALRLVDRSWKMYPVGFLFGLGFDTASEVGLLGLSAAFGAGGQLPIGFILILPLLFAAGMSLVDTADGVLMLGAYGWAFVKPVRKLYYNLNITLVSVLVAFVIGGIELLQVIRLRIGGQGPFWSFVSALDLQSLGVVIIAVFIAAWGASTLIYKLRGFDEIGEQRLDAAS